MAGITISPDLAPTIIAIGSVIGTIGGIVSPIIVIMMNRKVNKVSKSIDGLLEQKTLADKAIGELAGLDKAAKEEAIANKRELQVRREQELLNQPPPQTKNSDTNVSEAKDEIIGALKTKIEEVVGEKGDEIQKVVQQKGDDIQEGVDKVPDKVVEKVIEKLPPTKKLKP